MISFLGLAATDVNSDTLKDTKPILCQQCCLPILDQYLNKLYDKYYHEECLRCAHCQGKLITTCFVKENEYYCKQDYNRYALFYNKLKLQCLLIGLRVLIGPCSKLH